MRAHEFDQPQAAGCILYAEDTGRWGLQQRSDTVGDPGLWAAWGGGREPGESLEQCVRRELAEESGYRGPLELQPLARNAKYVTFIGIVPREFEPRPCDEWKDYCWVELGRWPTPLHPGVAEALQNVYIKENFADGKVKGKSRPGRVKRSGASCSGSVTDLRAKAKKYGGERGKMYHWCANMKGGRKKVSEVNVNTAYDPDELTVKQTFIDYFTNKGYKMLGEGRDQIAFLTPRQTVLKVLGFGNEQRERAVEDYVEFFLQHQNNPYYPKIYNTQRFDYQGDSHFMYETEYLEYVANEEDTLDWLETYMDLLARGGPEQAQQFIEEEGIPNELTLEDVQGLTQATREIQENLAGYVVDLSNIENIRRRKNGHLVIVDPVSL